MSKTNIAPSLKSILSLIAMVVVAVIGIIGAGTIDEALLDSIQAW